ncbi:MAG: M23 family metallopeptidase [Cytophagaceae bacterium]|jgi:murein DD-endopeptidase MepM/ murein hydrolase activator NlpD|nr:M23 family metallopeptidase [Cytophagaceae bacterium]
MSKIKFYYDPETCRYKPVRTTWSEIIWNGLGFLLVSTIMGALLLLVYTRIFRSPEEQLLRNRNKELKLYYELINKDLDELSAALNALEKRDEKIYRSIFESRPIPDALRYSAQGTIENYQKIISNPNISPVILSTFDKLERLKKRVYVQSKSYNEIDQLAQQKTQLLASIPAIQPVSNPSLTMLVSGFGYRIHPIFKVRMFHSGVDFNAPRGTPVYATGDGVIQKAESNAGGYGKEIEIDHGFGYVTKYAHLDRFAVKIGQKVKRGELIGYSGNTGSSTAPHLHYEVIHNGDKVNPVHYFFKDLNNEQYKKILQLAEVENQSLS